MPQADEVDAALKAALAQLNNLETKVIEARAEVAFLRRKVRTRAVERMASQWGPLSDQEVFAEASPESPQTALAADVPEDDRPKVDSDPVEKTKKGKKRQRHPRPKDVCIACYNISRGMHAAVRHWYGHPTCLKMARSSKKPDVDQKQDCDQNEEQDVDEEQNSEKKKEADVDEKQHGDNK